MYKKSKESNVSITFDIEIDDFKCSFDLKPRSSQVKFANVSEQAFYENLSRNHFHRLLRRYK